MGWRHWLRSSACLRGSIVVSFVALLGGCAIHPLTENVTGLDTMAVVHKIRCEARHAIKQQVVWLLEKEEKINPALKGWAKKIDENLFEWRNVPRHELSQDARDLIARYDGALMYFDFTFTISEENNVSSEVNLLGTLARGTDGLGIKASNNRKRQNIRNFRVQDNFEKLLDAKITCGTRSRGPDYMYPVTGEIGLNEVVDTFLQLNETGILQAGIEKDRLFADTLTFTTTVSGTAAPKIVLSPIGKALSLSEAGFTATGTRTDMHQVLIGLSLPSEVAVITERKIRSKSGSRTTVVAEPVKQLRVQQSDELNRFMDFQIQRNLILNATENRPLLLSIF